MSRYGIKWTSKGENNQYSYFKFEVNLPEIVATIAVLYYLLPYIPAIVEKLGEILRPFPGVNPI